MLEQRDEIAMPEKSGANEKDGQRPGDKREAGEKPGDRDEPEDGAHDRDAGRNRTAKTERDDAEGDASERAGGARRWGVLPGYEGFARRRGGELRVPDRYRRFHEAILRQRDPRRRAPERGETGGRR